LSYRCWVDVDIRVYEYDLLVLSLLSFSLWVSSVVAPDANASVRLQNVSVPAVAPAFAPGLAL